ncbi:MAG: hypothetical protein KIS92_04840 [Planctomycetota bacterium]|nr:hypothetical protein [Planctomycetota bacterium]
MNLNGWSWYRAAAFFSAGALWCGTQFGAVHAEDQAPKPEPQLRPLPQNQKQVGAGIEGIGRQLGDLLEQIEENRVGEAARDLSKHAPSRAKLGELSDRTIPRIVDQLRQGELEQSLAGQDAVIRELTAMITSLKTELGPYEAERELRRAIELQTKASGRLGEQREKDPAREGKRPGDLTPEQRNENKEVAGGQRDVTDAIGRAIGKLKEEKERIEKTDPAGANEIGRIVDDLERNKPSEKSDTAAGEIEANRPANAGKVQGEVLETLRRALAQLPGQHDPERTLEERIARLETAQRHQGEANAETGGLKPEDEEGANRALKHQGEVTEDVNPNSGPKEPGARDPVLDPLHRKSREISRKIAEGKLDEGRGLQGELAREIGRALTETKKQLADAKNNKGQPGTPGKPEGQPGAPGQPGEPGQPGAETAQSPEPSEAKESKEHEGGVGAFTYGKLRGAPREEGWNVSLAGKERADVEQAQTQKIPSRYRKQIEAYYQCLASQ